MGCCAVLTLSSIEEACHTHISNVDMVSSASEPCLRLARLNRCSIIMLPSYIKGLDQANVAACQRLNHAPGKHLCLSSILFCRKIVLTLAGVCLHSLCKNCARPHAHSAGRISIHLLLVLTVVPQGFTGSMHASTQPENTMLAAPSLHANLNWHLWQQVAHLYVCEAESWIMRQAS